MEIDHARETALRILYEIEEKDAYSNIALDRRLETSGLKEIDRAFVTELVYGTVKWKLYLDWVIERFSKVRLKKISPWILNILRMGVYQLLYTTKVPESAACNESVNLALKHGHQASAGFTNAILRNVARNKQKLTLPDRDQDNVKYLSVKYSHPEWMVKRFLSLYGNEFTESLLDSNNRIPEFSVRVNTLKTSRDKLIKELSAEGIESEAGRYLDEALVLKNPSSISRLNAFKNGLFQVQDESSMLVARILGPKAGELVIDACSAPGGKAAHMAQLMGNKGTIIARDVYEHKIKLIKDTAKRLGFNIIKPEIFDSTMPDEKYAGRADRVLLDAPCSGLGIIRRKADIRWAREAEDVKEIAGLQLKLINAVSTCVKPGGVLVYSTCTILPEENSDVVKRFISENIDFELDDITQLLPPVLSERHADLMQQGMLPQGMQKGMLQLYPNTDGIDGFFIARLKRRK